MEKNTTTTNAAGATQPAWAARPYSALRADGTLISRAEYHYDRDAITWARSLGAAMLLDAIQRDIMPAPAPTHAGHINQPVTPAQVADARKKLARLDYEAQAWGGTAEDMPESEALYAIIASA